MAQRRQHPYTWTTWPPRLIPGQNSCEWAGWFKAQHHGWTRVPSDFDQARWLTRHTALLNDQLAHWQNRGTSFGSMTKTPSVYKERPPPWPASQTSLQQTMKKPSRPVRRTLLTPSK